MATGASECDECTAAFDHVWDIEWSRNPLDPRNLLGAVSTIRQVVEREQYDIVHVHTPVAAFITRLALRNLRRKKNIQVIYTAHGFHFHPLGHPLKNRVFLELEKLAGRWTDHLVVINRVDEQVALQSGISSRENTHYIPGIGVDTSNYDPARINAENISKIRQELELLDDIPLFLMIAEFNPGKRHKDIIRAFSDLRRKHKAYLAFAGTGKLLEDMQNFAKECGVSDDVRFLGKRNDIPALIRTSIATVLPSIREGLPRSVMESLSMQTPVIGADIRGMHELLENGCGILFPPGDVTALADAMEWMLTHPADAVEMGFKGREKMLETFEIGKIVEAHVELYNAVGNSAGYNSNK